VLHQRLHRLTVGHDEDPVERGRLRLTGVRLGRLGDPPERGNGPDAARRPAPAEEPGQLGAAAGEDHGRRLPRLNGFPHREHRPAQKTPEEGDHTRRRARQAHRAPEERRAPGKNTTDRAPPGHDRLQRELIGTPRAARAHTPPALEEEPDDLRHLGRPRLRHHARAHDRHESMRHHDCTST